MHTDRIHVRISPNDVLTLHPVRIVADGGRAIVGMRGGNHYLSTSPEGAEAIRLLRRGQSIESVSRRLGGPARADAVDILPLVERLVNAGIVSQISGRKLDASSAERGTHPLLRVAKRRVAWLFSPAMAALYLLMALIACLCLFSRPSLLMRPREIYSAGYASAASMSILAGLLNAAKHELCHALAAWYLGVGVRFSAGLKCIFPVFQTDLSDVWSVARGRRHIAYLAGMCGDAITLAGIVIVMFVANGFLISHPVAAAAGSIAFYVAAAHIAWQFAIFTKTDLYYVLANAAGAHNLHRQAWDYLRSLALFCAPQRGSGRIGNSGAPAAIRVYAVAMAAGYVVCIVLAAAYLYQISALLGPDSPRSLPEKLLLAASPLLAISAFLISQLRGAPHVVQFSVSGAEDE